MLTFFLPKVLGSSTPCNFSTSEKFQKFRAPVSSFFYLLSWAVSLFLFSSLRFISPFCQKVDFWSSFDIWYILHDIFLSNIDNSGEVLEAPENSNPFTCFRPSIISVSTCKGWLTPQRPPLRNETLVSEGGTLEGGRLTMVINPSKSLTTNFLLISGERPSLLILATQKLAIRLRMQFLPKVRMTNQHLLLALSILRSAFQITSASTGNMKEEPGNLISNGWLRGYAALGSWVIEYVMDVKFTSCWKELTPAPLVKPN